MTDDDNSTDNDKKGIPTVPSDRIKTSKTFLNISEGIDVFYKQWFSFEATYFVNNTWPDNLDNNLRKALDIAYKAFPEEFYTLSKLPVVTPSNCIAFIKHMSSVMNQGKHNKILMFEIMSGSSVFSKLCYSAGIMTLFPVGY